MQCHATEVDALKTQNGKLVQSNCALQSELNELGRRAQALEYEHDALEQYTRKFNVEIHGVPEYEGENLQDIVMKIGLKMSVDVTTQDIDIVHRLFRKSQAIQPIIVRFTSYKKRREFYRQIPFERNEYYGDHWNCTRLCEWKDLCQRKPYTV